MRPNIAIGLTHLDDLIKAVPGLEPGRCLVIKGYECCMLALQITFRTSFQPVDLTFYVGSKVVDNPAQVGIMLELTIVSLENYRLFDLIT